MHGMLDFNQKILDLIFYDCDPDDPVPQILLWWEIQFCYWTVTKLPKVVINYQNSIERSNINRKCPRRAQD